MSDPFESYGKSQEEPRQQPPDPTTKNELFDSYPSSKAIPESEDKQPESHNQGKGETGTEISTKHGEIHSPTAMEDLDQLLNELDHLTGLRRVKDEVRRLVQFVHIQQLRQQEGISNSRPALHSVFYGNPGTGKTTIARLYGRMLCALGLLSRGHLVETDRSGLVASYVGQTAAKTDEKIKEALGGVLFIDEAYSLSKGDEAQWDYGSEAIQILIKRMEDYRDDLVIIAAGYPAPMTKFLSSNEGLKSRFSTYIYFEDYTPREMLEIFQQMCERENYELVGEALDFVRASIEYNHSIRDASFGNARFVRNLFESIIRNQALRIGLTSDSPSINELRQILPEDIPFITPSDAKPFG